MTRKRREIWVADAETDPFKHGRIPEPFLWGAYNGNEYREFADTRDFVAFMSSRRAVCYAHNGGKFDWFFILDALEPFSPMTVINGRLAKFKIGDCEFRDSWSILPTPLSAYKKDEIDYGIFERNARDLPENAFTIRKYLRNDCIYLHELVTGFIAEYGDALTLASAAMRQWREISDETAPRTTPHFYASLHKYYFGGRVQTFKTGVQDFRFNVYDIKSAYPFAMKHKHAYGDCYIHVDSLPTRKDVIERAFITLTCESWGAFPIRAKDGLEFPDDGAIREFHVTGWEYLAARDLGLLKRAAITDCVVFFDTIEFGEYVDHFFALKQRAESDGDKAKRLYAKLFLNSLYGKFAANPETYSEFTVIEPQFIEASASDEWTFVQTLGPWALMQRPLPEEKRHYYNVATAASITGFVRAHLLRALKTAKTPLYCDTDAIACVSLPGTAIGDSLGDWTLEAECNRYAIAGKKLYAFRTLDGGYKTASKGVRLRADQIEAVARGEIIEYRQDAPTLSVTRKTSFLKRKIRLTSRAR